MASDTHKSKCTNSVQPLDPDEGGRRRLEVTEGVGGTARGGKATSTSNRGMNGRREAKRGAAWRGRNGGGTEQMPEGNKKCTRQAADTPLLRCLSAPLHRLRGA